jgi:hypothetical protein
MIVRKKQILKDMTVRAKLIIEKYEVRKKNKVLKRNR